jgi:hypothetical protein
VLGLFLEICLSYLMIISALLSVCLVSLSSLPDILEWRPEEPPLHRLIFSSPREDNSLNISPVISSLFYCIFISICRVSVSFFMCCLAGRRIRVWREMPLLQILVLCGFRRVSRNCGKMTVSFVMSVRPRGTARLPLDGFSWNLISFVSKICLESSSVLKIWQV